MLLNIENLQKEAFRDKPYSLPQDDKNKLLLKWLNTLTEFHYRKCPEYKKILNSMWKGFTDYSSLKDFPYLPVSIFKNLDLISTKTKDIKITLTSSGTTGQNVSKIFLDVSASTIQQKALANSLSKFLGAKRLPMLVIDTKSVFNNPKLMSARGAGVLGLMRYGTDHHFALDENGEPDFKEVKKFLKKYKGKPFFMFGFTFMVWKEFYNKFKSHGLDLSNGVLIHSGGWKKMIEEAVSPNEFRSSITEEFNLDSIYNFYGMVEQIGSLFFEGPSNLLYPPNFADVIIRDPETFEPLPNGKEGLIQVLSMLPTSYPGNSLLTEDLGIIENIDPNVDGWMGKGLRIIGRVPKAELRGCSDVIGETS
ncbi:MAG: acyl-protein synthetase [Candidatus Marinimicrobia bacterium]|nr:acyl-protein synthetase [Candidatus Neomarinimicrobiota bacterium]|tara:strand:+ start:3440 stop:4531 length:1092 start_codon:yes stop_codon:yes gene_type:complete